MRTRCPYYVTWRNMIRRTSSKYQRMKPTYQGCKVCDSWLSFPKFKRWMEKQDWQGKQLDKDLLGDGKLYSPKTCVFVPLEVNNFTTTRVNARGQYPLGVSRFRSSFKASVSISSGSKHLGYFNTPEEAHVAYCKVKRELCLGLIKRQTCPRIRRGLRRWMWRNLN